MPDFSWYRSTHCLIVLVVFEERFIRADNLGVFLQALAHARAQANDAIDAVGRQERIAENILRLLTDAVDAAGALNQPDDRPGQIVVDDDRGVLKVLPFAQHVGRDQDSQFILGLI